METAIEAAARVIFETWGGPWTTAPEFRREQARKEALSVFEAIKANQGARDELMEFLQYDMLPHE
jgi:hypothetical protein